MGGRAVRGVIIAVLVVGTWGVLASDAEAQTALRKAGRGLAAMTTGFLEIPGNTYQGAVEDGVGGGFLGFAKGLGMIVPRTLVGVYEFVSAPIPAPANFRPILQPEFPWEYFSSRRHAASAPAERPARAARPPHPPRKSRAPVTSPPPPAAR